MLVVLKHHMKRKSYQFNITHLYNFIFTKKMSNTSTNYATQFWVYFESAGFLAIHIQFVYYQQRKQVFCANV